MKLSGYERETIINFNAREKNATLYTRDRINCQVEMYKKS